MGDRGRRERGHSGKVEMRDGDDAKGRGEQYPPIILATNHMVKNSRLYGYLSHFQNIHGKLQTLDFLFLYTHLALLGSILNRFTL